MGGSWLACIATGGGVGNAAASFASVAACFELLAAASDDLSDSSLTVSA
jgi:hypothetical protein